MILKSVYPFRNHKEFRDRNPTKTDLNSLEYGNHHHHYIYNNNTNTNNNNNNNTNNNNKVQENER